MHRRSVLFVGGATVASGLAAAALSWPGWLRRAFSEGATTHGGEPIQPEHGTPCQGGMKKNTTDTAPAPKTDTARKILSDAAAKARAENKKLLVLVVPYLPPPEAGAEKINEASRQRILRGELFGEYLNHGSDADLAPLASSVVVCAQVPDVREALGATIQSEPLLLVLDPGQQPIPVKELNGTPEMIPFSWEKGPDKSKEDKVIDAHIKLVADLVRQGLGSVPTEKAAEKAREVRQAIVKKAPQGGRWGNSTGCGASYEDEGDKAIAMGCGMGHVPKRSSRFLDFLTSKSS